MLLLPAVWPVEVRRLFFLALITSVFALLPLKLGVRRPVLLSVASVLRTRITRTLCHHLHAIYLKAKLTLHLSCQVSLVYVFRHSL